MAFFDNLRIPQKLVAAFGVLLVVLAITSGITLKLVTEMDRASDSITSDWLPAIITVNELEKQVLQHRRFELTHVLTEENSEIARLDGEIAKIRAAIADLQRQMEKTVDTPEQRQHYDAFNAAYARYLQISDQVLAYSRRQENKQAFDLIRGEGRAVFRELAETAEKLVTLNAAGAAEARKVQDATAQAVNIGIVLAMVVFAVVALAAGLLLRRAIATPVTAMTGAMRKLADGDKAVDIPARGRGDEIGAMAEAVQVFKDNAIRADRLAAEQEAERAAREARAKAIEALTARFDEAVSGMLGVVSGAATEM
ncbi:MAG: MCP four helix bundle domain-containing protein [Bacteroidales bacterium]